MILERLREVAQSLDLTDGYTAVVASADDVKQARVCPLDLTSACLSP